MPEICRFYGIVIQMYFDDHAPPHFHARYAGSRAVVNIDPPILLHGQATRPRPRNGHIEWARMLRNELLQAWDRAQRRQPPGKIVPLE